jgi:hypothetical protein
MFVDNIKFQALAPTEKGRPQSKGETLIARNCAYFLLLSRCNS